MTKRFKNHNRNIEVTRRKENLNWRGQNLWRKDPLFLERLCFPYILCPTSNTVTRKYIANRYSPTFFTERLPPERADTSISVSIIENLVTPNVRPDIYSRSLRRTIQPCYRRTNDNSSILPTFDNTSSALIQPFVLADRFSPRPRKLTGKLFPSSRKKNKKIPITFDSSASNAVANDDKSFFSKVCGTRDNLTDGKVWG